MYSQNDEERVIEGIFSGYVTGSFLDIGAYDGKTFSNTLRLVEKGWSGVCVEPSPNSFDALLRLHGGNSSIQLVNCAVASTREIVPFYDSGGDAVSTTYVAHKEKWEKGSQVRFKKFFVHSLPLTELFTRFGFGWDFINLDVESANLELFKLFPWWNLHQLKCVCVEHDGHDHEMTELAATYGFTKRAFNGENLILAR